MWSLYLPIIIKHIVVAIANSTRNDALPLYWCYVSELYILRYLLFLFCNIYIFSAIKTIFSANKILGYTDPPVLKSSMDSFTGGSGDPSAIKLCINRPQQTKLRNTVSHLNPVVI